MVAVEVATADDDVVVEWNTHCVAGSFYPLGEVVILNAGARVIGRVVVG